MGVKIFNRSKDVSFKPYYEDIAKIYEITLNKLKLTEEYDIALILVRSKFIQKLNKEYRHIDRPTDVITFAMHDDLHGFAEEENDLGDVYINIDYVYAQAKEYNHSIRREFCFLFTHGLLHSLGYDHLNKADEEVMFSLQREILDLLVKR